MDDAAIGEAAPHPTAPPPRHTPWEPFPQIDLRQTLRLSDDTGIFQHAVYGTPDPNHGYCIDDNARALIAALLHQRLRGADGEALPLNRYVTFLAYAWNDDARAFRNFMGYDRHWLEDEGSQDSQARTIWALGLAVNHAPRDSTRELAYDLINKGMEAVERFAFLRSHAFALIGLHELLQFKPDHARARELFERCADRLATGYSEHATEDWPWWEDVVTYDNAKLCHAMLVGGQALGRADMIDAGLTSLKWLLKMQTAEDGRLSIIGNNGWLQRGKPRARFDQQPLEAYAMVHACLTAARQTGDKAWEDHAWVCFEWFRGRNDLGLSLYDEETGGCQDGLEPDGVNRNQGAESTLAYLLSVLELHLYREENLGRVTAAPPGAIGYAVVGASKFADFCLDAYRPIEGLRPAAVWNRTPQRARTFAEQHGLTAYEALQDLVEDPNVQLVHIASTPAQHAEQAIAALRAGKHVLCEKPIATTGADAQRMIDAAAERDLRLGVNFVMRHGPLARAITRLIESNALGAPLRGVFTNLAGDSGLPPGHWFWDEAVSGGIFIEHGVHFFDLVRSWLGEATVVDAFRLRRPDTEDQIIDQVGATLRYGPQTTVAFYHGFHQSPHLDRQDFRLAFERGELTVEGWVAAELSIRAVLNEPQAEQIAIILPDAEIEVVRRLDGETASRRGRVEPVDREVRITWRDTADKQTIYRRAVAALMEDMLEWVRDRRHPVRVTAQDGRAALALAREADRIARGATP